MLKGRAKSTKTCHRFLQNCASFLFDSEYTKIYGLPPKSFNENAMLDEFKNLTNKWMLDGLKYLGLENTSKFHLDYVDFFNSDKDWEFIKLSTTYDAFGHRLSFLLWQDQYDYRLPVGIEIHLESFGFETEYWNLLSVQYPYIVKLFLEDRIKLDFDNDIELPNAYLNQRKKRKSPFEDLQAFFSEKNFQDEIGFNYRVRYMTTEQTINFVMRKFLVFYDVLTAKENYEKDSNRLLKHYLKIYDK